MAALPAIKPPEPDDSPIPGSNVAPISAPDISHLITEDDGIDPDFEPPSAPDISHLITEDDEPVDSILSEKQQRLLTEPLYSSWSGPPPEEGGAPRPFVALANVGFFPKPENRPLVPDMMLSVDVQVDEDLSKKENRSYFLWKHGKPPDVVIEIVSNKGGGELGKRMQRYRVSRVPYYVVHDPLHCLGEERVRAFRISGDQYQRMETPRFESFGLALTEWEGTFENHTGTWLRWCTLDGKLIPTGAERAEEESKRADEERKRADEERKRADEAAARAAQAEERVRLLEEMLRAQNKG
jgi:hypothetical protein